MGRCVACTMGVIIQETTYYLYIATLQWDQTSNVVLKLLQEFRVFSTTFNNISWGQFY
jgi:hypothetical protein